ncbi:hypothetical protein MNB_SV-3-1237 [hydrothermal vent metagenome]|uniref:Helix-turn-helix domain-containing protein n=1 Tax=hydrothermal vent metagenome TaxID=652676 RepID=A0A1W1CP40_9ZZZZ
MFDELENTLKEILHRLDEQQALLQVTLNSLTTSKAVANFLGISQRTIQLWVKQKKLQEGTHYYRDGKRLVFIPAGILELKNPYKGSSPLKEDIQKEKTPKKKTLNPVAKKILGDLKKVSNG